MDFQDYYTELNLQQGDSVLVTGDNSLFLALYLAGKAREEGKEVKTRALIGKESTVVSISEALESEKKNYAAFYDTLKKGVVNTSFGRHDLLEQSNILRFNKIILKYDDWNFKVFAEHLKKIYELCEDNTVILIKNGFTVFRMLSKTEKRLFKTSEVPVSFAEYLRNIGLRIIKQDIINEDSVLLLSIELKEKTIPTDYKVMPKEKWAEAIMSEVGQIALACSPTTFAIKKGDYYYVISMTPRKDEKAVFTVKFLDWEHQVIRNVPGVFAKNILIVTLPVIPTFDKELQEKGIITTSPEKALELFKQR